MCNGKRLCGAKFVLCDECGKEIACGVTNECGELIFDPLPCGRYFIREICAPEGYKLNEECGEVVVTFGHNQPLVESANTCECDNIKVVKYGV